MSEPTDKPCLCGIDAFNRYHHKNEPHAPGCPSAPNAPKEPAAPECKGLPDCNPPSMSPYTGEFWPAVHALNCPKRPAPPPEPTTPVLKTFETVADQRGAIMIRGLINAVKGIGSWCWKSNQPYKLGKRAVVHVGAWSAQYRSVGKIDDLNRTFAKMDGKPEPESLIDAFRAKWVGTDYVMERGERKGTSPYFDTRRFKNGNVHLIFTRPDLVDEANRLIASRYPHALAPK